MSKRILWVSRHEPIPSQLEALKHLYGGDTEVVPDPNPFDGADTIVKRYKDGGYDDMVVVAPLSVLGKLCDMGMNPLYAQMVECEPSDAELYVRRVPYKFERFRRVKRLLLEFFD